MFLGLRASHWILLGLIIAFLFAYFGLLSWGRIQDALETLAGKHTGAKVFQHQVDRADAIFMVFMFLFLSPLALAAVIGLVMFTGAVLTGAIETVVRAPGLPEWAITGCVYLLLVVVAYVTRAVWIPQAQGLGSLLARAVLAAYR